MTNCSGLFTNVLLELWKELPHEIMLGRAKSLETVRTLKWWGIPLGVPEKVSAGGFTIAEFAVRD